MGKDVETIRQIDDVVNERARRERGDARRSGSAADRTYATAVQDGFYRREVGGLSGKYDNVRRYWEDQISRYAIRDYLEAIVARKRSSLSRVRALDLGAGAGEGYEILTSLKKKNGGLASKEVEVLPRELLGYYKGVDLSAAMVEQGESTYADDPKVGFQIGDLSEGLGAVMGDPPYDVYFSSYGSLSHLRDEELTRLLEDIMAHFRGSCVLLADLLGRYSFEWPCYWEQDAGSTRMRQYSMSYLYPEGALEDADVERFPLRYWGGREFDAFFGDLASANGVRIVGKRVWDRSILVGRHMDTGEFNAHAQPIRAAVNSLHEFDQRTRLESLVFDYAPRPGHPEINEFFEFVQMAWNAVVYDAIESLQRWNDAAWLSEPAPEELPEPVRESIGTIRNVIRHVKWFRMGDPRANVLEPQLGYVLRNLEMDLQRGLGCGHGLVAVYELRKE